MEADEIRDMVWSGMTHMEISTELKGKHPGMKGLSERSVRRFCQEQGISKPRDRELDDIVEDSVREVGHVYGRRMMKGVLEAKGVKVAESRVAKSLRRVAPTQYEQRRNDTIDRLNPAPYIALYFGHKLHIDQNEKLQMYGVTHFIVRDGFSGKIVSYCTIPIKNNLAIYESIFRSAVTTYGLWDQIRVDHGREFYLTLFIQEQLRRNHGPPNITAYVQSPSTENHTVERVWPEVNSRVNYPLKRILIAMEESREIDLTDSTCKFCVSFITCNVSTCGLAKFVAAWNHHSIPHRGVPNDLEFERNEITPIPTQEVIATGEAVQLYPGVLTQFGEFGSDPLRDREDLIIQREDYFLSTHPTFDDMFANAVSGDGTMFKNAILDFSRATRSFQQLL